MSWEMGPGVARAILGQAACAVLAYVGLGAGLVALLGLLLV